MYSSRNGRGTESTRVRVMRLIGWVAFAAACAGIGSFLTFALYRGVSLEALASILVAVGTGVLAYFTWQSVSRTSDVIAGEDRRHQQSLAPLFIVKAQATQRIVTEGAAETGIRVYNIGYGIATNIEMALEGTLHYTKTHSVTDSEENRRLYSDRFTPNPSYSVPQTLLVNESASEPFERRLSISALEARRELLPTRASVLGPYLSRPKYGVPTR